MRISDVRISDEDAPTDLTAVRFDDTQLENSSNKVNSFFPALRQESDGPGLGKKGHQYPQL